MGFHKFRVCLLLALVLTCSALAHKPLLSVDDNEDGTIYIEVGFSDGSSGSGHDIILKDMDGKVLNETKVPPESSLDIPMPGVPYTVTFSAGEGHIVTVDGPFSESSASEPEEGDKTEVAPVQEKVKPVAAAPQAVKAAPPVVAAAPASMPQMAVGGGQPVIINAGQGGGMGPGFDMAMKMMVTSNIIVAVFIAALLVIISFGIGYSVGRAKK